MNDGQGQADGQAGKTDRRQLMRRAQDDDQEDKGRNDFEDEGRHQAVAALIALAPTVLAKAGGVDVIAAQLARQDGVQHRGTEYGADDLGNDVGDEVLHVHAAGDPRPQRHRRIYVTPRYRADAIGHGDDGEPEGEGDAERQHTRLIAGKDRRTAAEKDQHEGADEFRNCFFHGCPL